MAEAVKLEFQIRSVGHVMVVSLFDTVYLGGYLLTYINSVLEI